MELTEELSHFNRRTACSLSKREMRRIWATSVPTTLHFSRNLTVGYPPCQNSTAEPQRRHDERPSNAPFHLGPVLPRRLCLGQSPRREKDLLTACCGDGLPERCHASVAKSGQAPPALRERVRIQPATCPTLSVGVRAHNPKATNPRFWSDP